MNAASAVGVVLVLASLAAAGIGAPVVVSSIPLGVGLVFFLPAAFSRMRVLKRFSRAFARRPDAWRIFWGVVVVTGAAFLTGTVGFAYLGFPATRIALHATAALLVVLLILGTSLLAHR